jgi:hypothetical protein
MDFMFRLSMSRSIDSHNFSTEACRDVADDSWTSLPILREVYCLYNNFLTRKSSVCRDKLQPVKIVRQQGFSIKDLPACMGWRKESIGHLDMPVRPKLANDDIGVPSAECCMAG